MTVLIKVLQLLLSLSILVVFHELGHFVAAKVFKTRVEKFYLFFNPWFSIFKFKKGETEYGMGWLPLGGYVKISGMIDESMDKEQMNQPAQPWEFRSKPAYQRLIIMLGGVTVNVLLAMAIYVGMLSIWGEEYLPTSQVKYGVVCDSLALEMGLQDGDQILTVDYKEVEDFMRIPGRIVLENAQTVQVLRQGQAAEVQIPQGFVAKMLKSQATGFVTPRFPFDVLSFGPDSPAQAAGVQVDDRIIGIGTVPTPYFDQFVKQIQNYSNQEVNLHVLRAQDTLHLPVRVTNDGQIGAFANTQKHFQLKKKEYNLAQAIPAGIKRGYKGIGDYLKQLKLLFSPEVKAYESVGGFISIGNIFPGTWDWHAFWSLTAFLSIMLAILNVLPIPALDGGHVMFLLFEIISGRKPSEKFLEYAQIVGMVLLLGLLVLANGNDILRLLNK